MKLTVGFENDAHSMSVRDLYEWERDRVNEPTSNDAHQGTRYYSVVFKTYLTLIEAGLCALHEHFLNLYKFYPSIEKIE